MRFDQISMNGCFKGKKGANKAPNGSNKLNGITDGNYFEVTGTAPIDGIVDGQGGQGILLLFQATLVLEHSSSFFLPTGANITTAANDMAFFVCDSAGNWRCSEYQRADGTALYAPSTYLTLDRTAWDALVAANGLVPGWRYRVTSAYTFDVYGAKDIVVTADSVNTIETTAYVLFGDEFVTFGTDFNFNLAIFYNSTSQMALTASQVLDYVAGNANFRFNAGLTIFIISGGIYYATQIEEDDTQIIFNNVKKLDPAGTFGTFDPNTDTFTPNANTWAPTATTDGTVMTGLTGVVSGKYSRVGNVLHYSFLISEGVFDFTAGNTGFVQIADSEFPFLPIGDHVVNASFSEPEVIGSIAINPASLRINFINKSTTLTVTTDISITGQCLL